MSIALNKNHARRALLGFVSAATLLAATSAGAMAQDKILLLINGALGDKSFFDSEPKGSGSDARRPNSGRPGWPESVPDVRVG